MQFRGLIDDSFCTVQFSDYMGLQCMVLPHPVHLHAGILDIIAQNRYDVDIRNEGAINGINQ